MNNILTISTKLALLFSEERDIPERIKNKKNKKIQEDSNELALLFSEERDIPERFKNKKMQEDSKVEQRFQNDVRTWQTVIKTMLLKIDNEKAWRFIRLKPKIEPQIKSVAYAQDFIDFTDYFILRRDIDQCDHEELGFLSKLYMEFQKEIEKRF
jgi:hypothetical protein